MKIPTFARSVKTCDSVLKPYDVDVIDILINRDAEIFDDALKMFIGVVVVQVKFDEFDKRMSSKPTNNRLSVILLRTSKSTMLIQDTLA